MKVVVSILITCLIVGLIASVGLSQPFGKHSRGVKFHLPRELRKTLTEQQVEKLQSLRIDVAKQVLPLRSEMKIKKLELRQLWTADELDEDAIIAKTNEIASVEKQIREKMTRRYLQVAKILTKQQRAKLMSSHHWGHSRHQERLNHRGKRFDRDAQHRRGRRHHQRRKHHQEGEHQP